MTPGAPAYAAPPVVGSGYYNYARLLGRLRSLACWVLGRLRVWLALTISIAQHGRASSFVQAPPCQTCADLIGSLR